MKNSLLPSLCALCLYVLFIYACTHKEKHLEYDDQPIIISDTVTVASFDKYYQSVNKITRGTEAIVNLYNDGDTARTFIIHVEELPVKK